MNEPLKMPTNEYQTEKLKMSKLFNNNKILHKELELNEKEANT